MALKKTGNTPPTPLARNLECGAVKSPAEAAVDSGLAGTTGEAAEKIRPLPESEPLPLPGMEAYFPPPPLELDNSSETLTKKNKRKTVSPLFAGVEPLRNDYKKLGLSESDHREIVHEWEDDNGFGVGACLNIFPSGEITGGCYALGRRNRSGGRQGKIISKQFTKQAKKTIRRAVQCNPDEFKLFVTLTFDPKISTLNESGQVDQDWAKKEFTRFLNSVKKKYDRMAEKTGKEQWELHYIWVAEIQEQNTKNIHFHILFNRPFMSAASLVKIWGQAPNSVNVKKLKNPAHAVNYMLKYMGKGNCPIEGKRYGMTQKLLEKSQPTRIRFEGRTKRKAFLGVMRDSFTDISESGGFLSDWGFAIPPAKRCKGKGNADAANSRKAARNFLKRIEETMAGIDATTELLDDLDEGNMERAAIMDCEAGIYEGVADRITFGGDE